MTAGIVNCADLALIRAALNTGFGQPSFNSRADLNYENWVVASPGCWTAASKEAEICFERQCDSRESDVCPTDGISASLMVGAIVRWQHRRVPRP